MRQITTIKAYESVLNRPESKKKVKKSEKNVDIGVDI